MTTDINTYLDDGCGRCNLFATDDCKVRKWHNEVKSLREILISTGLEESMKWGSPCYTFGGKNILMLAVLKENPTISFFKGALLKDEQNLLSKPGENSQSARYMKFNNVTDILDKKAIMISYIYEAVEIEKAGIEVDFTAKNNLKYPTELLEVFNEDQQYKEAFERLTPGRKRSYILLFTQPKQSATRTTRIYKYKEKVMLGKGAQEY